MHELGVQAPTGPCGRDGELLAKMRRHPEQKSINLSRHFSAGIFSYLRSNINFNHADINPSTRPKWPGSSCSVSTASRADSGGQRERPSVPAPGIEPERRIYGLRHTYATFSLAAGVSLFTLSRRMGTSVERYASGRPGCVLL